jgi:diamine N-acetyltransferase
MEPITLRDITYDNLKAVIKMHERFSEEDQHKVAPNVVSLAEAYLNYAIAWPKAIYCGENPVGFVMLGLDDYLADKEDTPVYFLWRLMIAPEEHGKGIGKEVIRLLVEKCVAEGRRYLYVSCHTEEAMPKAFYEANGFVSTGRVDEGELILKLKI